MLKLMENIWKFATFDSSSPYISDGKLFIANSDNDLREKILKEYQGTVVEGPLREISLEEMKEGKSFRSDESRYGNPVCYVKIYDNPNEMIGHLSFCGFNKRALIDGFNAVQDTDSLFEFVAEVNEAFECMETDDDMDY